MRRKLTTAAAVAATAAAMLLTSCSSGGSSGDDEGAASTDLKATISYGFWDAAQKPTVEKNIKEFNKTYPNITVTPQVTPYANYFTKLQTEGASKTLPDVFWINGLNVQLYMANHLLEPITPLVKAGKIDPSDFPKSLIEKYSYEGKHYGVPHGSATIALWYNKAIFKEAGVEPPTDDWTWDDFHQAAKTISDKLKDKGIYGVTTALTGQQAYYNTILQAGGFVISKDKKTSGFDDPGSIKGLQFWRDLIADGSSPTVKQLSDTPANKWFDNGKSAMMWSGPWEIPTLKKSPVADNVDVAPLPKGERRGVVVAGAGMVVSAFSKHMKAAQAFQAFLGSKKAQTIMAGSGSNPAMADAQEAFVKSVPSYNLAVFENAEKYAFPFPTSKNTSAWNEVENKLLPKAFSGQEPVAKVAKQLAEQMDKLLADE